ncbi:MAG TPA: hypothetical protein VHT72_02015, partial [Puia sp.]|nr:hypothetical protein [Puia sp.]
MKYFKKEFLYRILFGLSGVFLLPLILCAQNNTGLSVSIPSSPRQHISLDADWKFHFGHAADPAKDFDYSTTAIFSKT